MTSRAPKYFSNGSQAMAVVCGYYLIKQPELIFVLIMRLAGTVKKGSFWD
jgi:hypothetical protein